MKFFHLSDLHIGKQLNGYSLRESQEAVFQQIFQFAEEEQPDAILICGDIYDKSVPSAEAFTAFDHFLTELSERAKKAEILVISGNHDSAERLAYASSFLSRHRIHIGALPPKTPDERLKQITLQDSFGAVHFYLAPFLKPGYVRYLFEDGVVTDYDSAFRAVLSKETIKKEERNVILAHQFFVNGEEQPDVCDSETVFHQVGGLDCIDVSALDAFDYAALGHLHGPQKIREDRFRYCGSPGKYSVSEEFHKKSITVVTLAEKGAPLSLRFLPLVMQPELRRLKGTMEEIKSMADRFGDDYVSITLTDEEERFDFREQLEERYARILDIRIENTRTKRKLSEELETETIPDPMTAFSQFFEAVRHMPLSREQEKLMREIVIEAEEEQE